VIYKKHHFYHGSHIKTNGQRKDEEMDRYTVHRCRQIRDNRLKRIEDRPPKIALKQSTGVFREHFAGIDSLPKSY